MFHQKPYTHRPVETVWLTMPKEMFTQFLVSQNGAIVSRLVMLGVGLIGIEHEVCNWRVFVFCFFVLFCFVFLFVLFCFCFSFFFFFPKIAIILVI